MEGEHVSAPLVLGEGLGLTEVGFFHRRLFTEGHREKALLGKSGVKLVVAVLAVLSDVHLYLCKSYYTLESG